MFLHLCVILFTGRPPGQRPLDRETLDRDPQHFVSDFHILSTNSFTLNRKYAISMPKECFHSYSKIHVVPSDSHKYPPTPWHELKC